MDPVEYVLTENLYRRHLTQGQKGMVAVRALDYHMQEAKERQRAAGRFAGKEPDGTPKVAVQEAEKPAQAALPGVAVQLVVPGQQAEKPAFERKAISQAGKAVGVSGTSKPSVLLALSNSGCLQCRPGGVEAQPWSGKSVVVPGPQAVGSALQLPPPGEEAADSANDVNPAEKVTVPGQQAIPTWASAYASVSWRPARPGVEAPAEKVHAPAHEAIKPAFTKTDLTERLV